MPYFKIDAPFCISVWNAEKSIGSLQWTLLWGEVPFLEKILGENVKVSHATTVLVIFPVCAVAAAIYAAGGSADMPETLFVMAGGAAGGAFGSIALKAAAPKAVAVIFAVIVAAAGVCMICGR